MTTLLSPSADAVTIDLPGLEPDNLLAFLALLGLLRALETSRPGWQPRVSWRGPPWTPRLHLQERADENEIAKAAAAGIETIVSHFDVDGRKNVDFSRCEYRTYARRVRGQPVAAALAAALTAEAPVRRDGSLNPGPLVMMFGQGHQNFLERLVAVPAGELPNRLRKLKAPPDLRDPAKIAEALFQSWSRNDDADGFRWDPEEDQRYALRFSDPSGRGAALTVHGANRLAAVGFLSFCTVPRERRSSALAAARDGQDVAFVWPIWSSPMSRMAVEALLAYPGIINRDGNVLRTFGITEVFRARRVSNGKYLNVSRAEPMGAGE